MSYEINIIDLIHRVMPNSPLRKSISGEVDCEVILLGDKEYLFTIDDFSGEDLLQESDPNVLGWNLACGAISDIIAAGGKPLLYSHSMVIPEAWDEVFIRKFSLGISRVLQKYSASFIGGDLGVGENWRYTASVIGVPIGRAVNRKGCQVGDSIFLTGKIGAGNLQAVGNLFSGNGKIETLLKDAKIKFRSHEKLPEIISKYASCAIDTSDGVFAALLKLSELNKTGFKIGNLHFMSKAVLAAKLLHIPEVLFFLGECGEYEILFAVSTQNKEALQAELTKHNIAAYEIGEITKSTKVKSVSYKNRQYNLDEYNIKARDFKNVKDYLKTMIEWLESKGESK